MSQLSSGGARKNRNKGNRVAKKTLCFLIIFAIVCVGITTACILQTLSIKNQKNDEELKEENIIAISLDKNKTIDLSAKYLTNGIEIENIKKQEGKLLKQYDDYGDYEYEIEYVQISGLKNTKIQKKINDEILDSVNTFKEMYRNSEYDEVSIYTTVHGNFSDVLSITIEYHSRKIIGQNEYEGYIHYDYDYEYDSVGLNYRLDTGEKLQFNDMFFKNVGIKNILSKAAYEAYAWNHLYHNEDMDEDFEDADYGYVEDEVFKTLATYNKNNDIDFYFDSKGIYATINNQNIYIKFEKYVDKIAVYTQYTKPGLYEENSARKEFYALTEIYWLDSLEIENIKGTNFYYEVIGSSGDDEEDMLIKQEAKDKIDEKLGYYYDIAKDNLDKAYLVSIKYYYSTYTPEDGDTINEYRIVGDVTKTDLNYFNEHFDEIISAPRRDDYIEVTCFDYSYYDQNIEFCEHFDISKDDSISDECEEFIVTEKEEFYL